MNDGGQLDLRSKEKEDVKINSKVPAWAARGWKCHSLKLKFKKWSRFKGEMSRLVWDMLNMRNEKAR